MCLSQSPPFLSCPISKPMHERRKLSCRSSAVAERCMDVENEESRYPESISAELPPMNLVSNRLGSHPSTLGGTIAQDPGRHPRAKHSIDLEALSQQNYRFDHQDGTGEASSSSSRRRKSPLPYKPAFGLHDIVYGTVCMSNQMGSRVNIMYHDQLQGFMPVDQSPMTPAETMRRSSEARRAVKSTNLINGHTRPFKVIGIPPKGMEAWGRGPLLSAMHYDKDMLWARVSQLHQLGVEEGREGKGCVPFKVKVHSFNSGGLVASVMGLEAFVPNSHISRRQGMSLDQAIENILGTEIEVILIEFTPYKAIKLSETLAKSYRLKTPGNVLRGTIVHVRP